MNKHKLRERDILILRDFLSGMKRSDIAAKHGVVRSTVYHRVDMLFLHHRERLPADIVAKLEEMHALKAQLEALWRD